MIYLKDYHLIRLLVLITLIIYRTMFVSSAKLDLTEVKEQFKSYVKQYSKNYDSATEYERRLDIFAASLMDIEEHKTKNLSWTKAINKFSDMTVEEFKSQYGGYIHKPSSSSQVRLTMQSLSEIPI